MPVHEFAHGWVAHKLGDDTAYYQGRLDFNPLAHLDPFGTILLLFTGFAGQSRCRSIPATSPARFRCAAAWALTAVAGPVANIILAFFTLLLFKILAYFIPMGNAVSIIAQILSLMVSINVSLAVFNLLPIPPLDGYNIVSYFIPAKWEYTIMQYQQYIFLGLMALMMFTNILSGPLNILTGLIYKLLNFATGFVDLIAMML